MQTKNIFQNLYSSKYLQNLPDFKEKKTQAFTTLVLTLIAISVFTIFAISPTLSTIANLQKQQEDNSFVEKKLQEKLRNLVILQNQYNLIQRDIPFVFDAIPKQPNVPSFIGQLSALATQKQVQVSRLQSFPVELSKNIAPAKYGSFVFSIDVAGSYPNLLAYLDAITKFQRIITIDTISIYKGDEKIPVLHLQVRGKAYFKSL